MNRLAETMKPFLIELESLPIGVQASALMNIMEYATERMDIFAKKVLEEDKDSDENH